MKWWQVRCDFKHGVDSADYLQIVSTIGSAVKLLIESGRPVDTEAAVSVIARTGMLTASDVQAVRCIAEEIFERTVH